MRSGRAPYIAGLVLAAIVGIVATLLRTEVRTEAPPRTDRPSLGAPATRTVDQVDVYHGVEVRDPYRWLEDASSPEVAAWVEAQRAHAETHLGRLGRTRLAFEILTYWPDSYWSVPREENGNYVFLWADAEVRTPVLCATHDLEQQATIIVDPTELPDGENAAIDKWWPSRDGRYVAYGVARNGADQFELRVWDLATGTDLKDTFDPLRFSPVVWDNASAGFWYAPDLPHPRVLYHRLGTSSKDDHVVFERPDRKEWTVAVGETFDGRWLLVAIASGSSGSSGLYVRDRAKPDASIEPFVEVSEAWWVLLAQKHTTFWFQTDEGAPRGRVVAIDIDDPNRTVREMVPERAGALIEVVAVNDQFVIHEIEEGASRLRLFRRDGTPAGEIPLPGDGTVRDLAGRDDGREALFSFESWGEPPRVHRYDFETRKTTVVFDIAALRDMRGRVSIERIEYPSKDATRVPMTILRPSDAPSKPTPTLLIGYGGFNVATTPHYDPSLLTWINSGGVVAIAHVRGDGGRGAAWHDAGRGLNKQNSFDDFIAAAEWLIESGVTTRAQLAIQGGSNGGLLIGAALTQRPNLFGAALCEVGVLDMLRDSGTRTGAYYLSEYGDPLRDEAQFRVTRAYSPVHNVRPGSPFPPTMIATGLHDERVEPMHSFKFAAALQAAQAAEYPVLLWVAPHAGHDLASGETIEEDAAVNGLAFLMNTVGLKLEGR